VAIAFGIRSEGGAFVFPVDAEARLDDRERQLLSRMARLRELEREVGRAEKEGQANSSEHVRPDSTSSEAGRRRELP